MRFAPLLYVTYLVLFGPAVMLSWFTEWIARCLNRDKHTDPKDTIMLIREDFRLLVRESESEGIIDNEAADILDRAVDFYKIKVADIMTPAENVKYIDSSLTVLEAVKKCREHNISRMPVSLNSGRGKSQWWIGIFNIYDIIFELDEAEWGKTKVAETISPAGTVFEDENIAEVLVKAKAAECPLLIVTDRQNRRLGIVTPIDVSRQLFS
jgi:CBS domain containing-hemolysin-like protein